jgi:hypothetical protein
MSNEYLNTVGRAVEQMLNADNTKHGFCLLVFDQDTSTKATYVSNVERQEIVKALRILVERLERG